MDGTPLHLDPPLTFLSPLCTSQVVKASHSKTPITFARPQPLSVRFAVFEKEAGEVLAYIHEKQREESASAKKQTAPPPQAAEPSPTDAGKDPSSAQTDAPDGQGAEQSTTEQAEGSAANPRCVLAPCLIPTPRES